MVRSWRKRIGAAFLCAGLVTLGLGFFAPAAQADHESPHIEGPFTGNELNRCNGVDAGDPGQQNTRKVLLVDESVLEPGGHATYEITFPAGEEEATSTFTVIDCVTADGDPLFKYEITNIAKSIEDNVGVFQFQLVVEIPEDMAPGTAVCNIAQTTGESTGSPGSNRKTDDACFVLGGGTILQKADSATGAALPGAKFTLDCDGDIEVSVDENQDGTYTTDALGQIAVNGDEGTTCELTEVVAPSGYTLDAEQLPLEFTLQRGETETITVENTKIQTGCVSNCGGGPTFGSLTVGKQVMNGVGDESFAFTVVCGGTTSQFNLGDGQSTTIFDLPTGTTCTVTEVGGTDSETVTWSEAVQDSDGASDGVVVVSGDESVTYTNIRTEVLAAEVTTTTTTTTTTTVAPPPPTVQGVTLARTGVESRDLMVMAGIALALGGLLLGWSEAGGRRAARERA